MSIDTDGGFTLLDVLLVLQAQGYTHVRDGYEGDECWRIEDQIAHCRALPPDQLGGMPIWFSWEGCAWEDVELEQHLRRELNPGLPYRIGYRVPSQIGEWIDAWTTEPAL